MPDAFDTPESAALAALKASVDLSKDVEYAGVIYEKDGKIHYTKPKTSGETHSVKVKVAYPKGAKLLGLYHTHPAGMDSDVFAQGDIDIAKKLKIPYYMGDVKNNRYNVFLPGESSIKRKLHGQNQLWATGTNLGAMMEEIAKQATVPTRSTNDILAQ